MRFLLLWLALLSVVWGQDVQTLEWDPGTSLLGTEVAASDGVVTGDFIFRIQPQTPNVGAWRTILRLMEGEADLYMRHTIHPNPAESSTITLRSTRSSGGEALLLPSSAFTVGQEWYIMVRCEAARWELVSGDLYFEDLGGLDFEDVDANDAFNSGESITPDVSTTATIGPEGLLFYRTEVPDGTPAWSLSASDPDVDVLVRKGLAPLENAKDVSGDSQLLVVPPYLQASSGAAAYFVALSGTPGTTVSLESKIHDYSEADFVSTTPIAADSAGFHTFLYQVPPNQIAWELQLVSELGNPNLSLRRDRVPSALDNDAVSEAPEGVVDSITLSPASGGGFGLSNGSFFVTVYSDGPFTADLISGQATVDPIAFEDVIGNTVPEKSGWHYYLLDDLESQTGIGWELELADAPEGTEIAIRRNAIPSRWQYRNGSTALRDSTGNLDRYVKGNLLQLPRHQRDVWYVGIFQPDTALGDYTLTARRMVPPIIPFNDGSAQMVTDHAVDLAKYYRVDVPFEVEGWQLIIDQVEAADEDSAGDVPLSVAVAKDTLPTMAADELFKAPAFNREGTTWPSGGTWTLGRDWTGQDRDRDGRRRYSVFLPRGRPLSAGSYYIGIIPSRANARYRIRNLGVGFGEEWDIPIQEITVDEPGTEHRLEAVPFGELAVVKLSVPDGLPSRVFELLPEEGDGFMAVRRGGLPTSLARVSARIHSTAGALYAREGGEELTLLPHSAAEGVTAGDYYAVMVSEGVLPESQTDDGPTLPWAPIDLTFRDSGPLVVTDAGAVPLSGLTFPFDLEEGELFPIDFEVPAEGVVAVQIKAVLEEGRAGLSWWSGPTLRTPEPAVFDGKYYGFDGGEDGTVEVSEEISRDFYTSGRAPVPLYSTDAIGNTFRALIRSEPGAAAKGQFEVALFGSQELPFETAEPVTVEAQVKDDWRYFEIDVPEESNAVGWQLTVEAITPVGEGSGQGSVEAYLRRDLAPPGIHTVTMPSTQWKSGFQYRLTKDWTTYIDNPDGSKHLGMLVPMGAPLQPGRYVLGVKAVSGDVAYQIRTRAIGEGHAIPVIDLPYGESAMVEDLPAREAAYFKIEVPEGTPNWSIQAEAIGASEAFFLALAKDRLPAISAKAGRPASNLHGTFIDRTGYPGEVDFEEYLILPSEGLTLTGGTYYLAAVSLGNAPGVPIGTGTVSLVIDQLEPIPVIDMGTFVVGEEPYTPYALPPGGIGLFKLTIEESSLDKSLALRQTAGDVEVRLVGADSIAKPAPITSPEYGVEGGVSGITPRFDGICHPLPSGVHHITVRAMRDDDNQWQAAFGEIGMKPCVDVKQIEAEATGAGALSKGVWDFCRIDIPEGPDAWELTLKVINLETGEISPGNADLMIRRNNLPTSGSGSLGPHDDTFPSGATYKVNQGQDWTRLPRSANNQQYYWGVIPMGKPLEPGHYYIGIYAKSSDIYYQLKSNLIGEDYGTPITEIPFTGSEAVTPDLSLHGKEAAYFKVTVPAETRSWQMGLETLRGDWTFAIRYGGIPGTRASSSGHPESGHGYLAAIPGSEHLLILPDPEPQEPEVLEEGEEPWEPFVKAGTYYIAAVSQGAVPTSTSVGEEPAEGRFFSKGPIPVTSIGSVGTSNLAHPLDIEGGQNVMLEFQVDTPTPALELRLDGRQGNPEFVLWTGNGDYLPRPPAETDSYGYLGGEVDPQHRFEASGIHTITNVSPGTYRLVARASRFADGYPNGRATLTITRKSNIPLAFGPSLATEALPSTHRATLSKGQKNVYEVAIPPTLEGEPILGWMIKLKQFQGVNTTLKAFHQEGGANPEVKVTGQKSLLLVPPWWQPDRTWFLSVEADEITDYEILSAPVAVEATWTMADAFGQTFGEVGLASAQELAEDEWHFYAVEIPDENSGLLRTFLTAVSGRPDLYLREGAIPTIDHGVNSGSGRTFDRQLAGEGSRYGNWVRQSSRFQSALDPGIWYLGIRANERQNARYRLATSTGQVDALNLDGGEVTDAPLVGGDWRYYKVEVPREPLGDWHLTFSRSQGDVKMYLRDTAPPGFGSSVTDIVTDEADAKNLYRIYDGSGYEPGPLVYSVPPLRPGSRYFIGIHGSVDSAFSLTSAFEERPDLPMEELPFSGGLYQGVLEPYSSKVFRVKVPLGADEWRHTASHSNAVEVRVDQGTLPPPVGSSADPPTLVSINVDGDLRTGTATFTASTWPLLTEMDYYIVATNTSDVIEPFGLAMNGALPSARDEDADGLPDLWEEQHYQSHAAFSILDDNDGDGLSNLIEFALNLSPSKTSTFNEQAVEVEVRDGVLVMRVHKSTAFDTSHLAFTVEASGDAVTWNTRDTEVLTDNAQILEVADTVPITSTVFRSLRLTVRIAEP